MVGGGGGGSAFLLRRLCAIVVPDAFSKHDSFSDKASGIFVCSFTFASL